MKSRLFALILPFLLGAPAFAQVDMMAQMNAQNQANAVNAGQEMPSTPCSFGSRLHVQFMKAVEKRVKWYQPLYLVISPVESTDSSKSPKAKAGSGIRIADDKSWPGAFIGSESRLCELLKKDQELKVTLYRGNDATFKMTALTEQKVSSRSISEHTKIKSPPGTAPRWDITIQLRK